MQRRKFLKSTTAALATSGCLGSGWLRALVAGDRIDLQQASVVLSATYSKRESTAARMLIEESHRRCGLDWTLGNKSPAGPVTIYAATRASWSGLGSRVAKVAAIGRRLPAEGFTLQEGTDVSGRWIAIFGADERGLLFGIGKLLRSIVFARQSAYVDGSQLNISSSPRYPLRGHQLGYRPKTNAYDGWTVEMWEQYIRDLAVFGTNAIELIPPRSDDLPDSPQFPLPPARMMVEMSRLADNYGLDVWIWYPAMDRDYSDSATVESAVKEWGQIFQSLPRIDAVFVPGGDPGHTEPKFLLALLEKQKENLRRYHPKAQMWVSPQSFDAAWTAEFLDLVKQPHTESWLDGVVFGPQSRLSLSELRAALPPKYPIRFYPDITHSTACQYPVPDWDIAYALTEGREIINPRPVGQANILRRSLPETIGFITYSEGCNDDANKFVWSALGWNPDQSIAAALRDFGHYFIGAQEADGFAHGLLNLEQNWRGPLATNQQVDVTLESFQDMERSATPATIANWRWQQALYRTYFDAYIRSRLLDETAHVGRARDILARVQQIGWASVPLGIGDPPAAFPANGLDPQVLLQTAGKILEKPLIQPAGAQLRNRVAELGYALFQSIRMQLAVERYQGEAVDRGANLDTLDCPVSDIPWLRQEIARIQSIVGPEKQIQAIQELLARTDPGPGGFYDELGNVANRPHLVPGLGSVKDPEFRHSPAVGNGYPDEYAVPIAWKHWGESLFDAPLKLRYEGLDPQRQYRVRVVYSGGGRHFKIRLMANDHIEIHPYALRPWPPRPQEFAIPKQATSAGELNLSWTREPGIGGNGRACQVAEVWLMPVPDGEKN